MKEFFALQKSPYLLNKTNEESEIWQRVENFVSSCARRRRVEDGRILSRMAASFSEPPHPFQNGLIGSVRSFV
jgi:hypothetical protein